MIDFLGYLAAILVVLSISVKTTSFKGTVFMRIVNGIGSVCFIIYGIIIKADPTAMANIISLIINMIYLIIEIKDRRRKISVFSKDM